MPKELVGNFTNKGTDYRPAGQPRRTEVAPLRIERDVQQVLASRGRNQEAAGKRMPGGGNCGRAGRSRAARQEQRRRCEASDRSAATRGRPAMVGTGAHLVDLVAVPAVRFEGQDVLGLGRTRRPARRGP